MSLSRQARCSKCSAASSDGAAFEIVVPFRSAGSYPLVGVGDEVPEQRKPLCARCRRRHSIGFARALYDEKDELYRCGGCWKPLDAEGECNTPKCCGNPPVITNTTLTTRTRSTFSRTFGADSTQETT